MSLTEKVTFSVDNCFVCSEIMGEFKNELTILTGYSDRQIYEIIEDIFCVSFTHEILVDAGICQNCFIKFNEYTEHLSLAKQIQGELTEMFEATQLSNDVKEEAPYEQAIMYENIDEENQEPTEEIFGSEEPEAMADGDPIIVEYDWLDQETKFTPAPLLKPKLERLNRSDEGFTIIKENDLKLYQCDICLKAFKERSKLKTHKEIHTDQRNVICPTCGKAFKTQACLRSHKRVHNPTFMHCDICGKTYTQKPELAKHIKFVHYQIREFFCDLCGSGFGSRGHLAAHKMVHQSPHSKANACHICSLSFHTRAKLDRHMKSHTGERNYECGICHKRFLYSYNVTAHIRHVHEKQKRKETDRDCHYCGKKFPKLWKLKEHIESQHPEYQDAEDIEAVIIEEETIE